MEQERNFYLWEIATFFTEEMLSYVLEKQNLIWSPNRTEWLRWLRGNTTVYLFTPAIGDVVRDMSCRLQPFVTTGIFNMWNYLQSIPVYVRPTILHSSLVIKATRVLFPVYTDVGIFTFMAIIAEIVARCVRANQHDLIPSVVNALVYTFCYTLPGGFPERFSGIQNFADAYVAHPANDVYE